MQYLMFSFLPQLQKTSSFAEYFAEVRDQWGKFSFDSSTVQFLKYFAAGIVFLLLLKIVVSRIQAVAANKTKKIITDLPYLLRKLSSRVEHMKEVTSIKENFNYRLLNTLENKWHKGRFNPMDDKNNFTVELLSAPGNPLDYVNNKLEIKYSFRDDTICVVTSKVLKYFGSKKSEAGGLLNIFLLELPGPIKLELKRKDIRVETSSEYPVRVYILLEEIDIPVACRCIDISAGGMLVELEEPEVGCLEYLLKRDNIVRKKRITENQAKKLTFYEVLSQPPIDEKQFIKFENQIVLYLEENTSLIYKAANCLSSYANAKQVELFFKLPSPAHPLEETKEILSVDNRTINCMAGVIPQKKGRNRQRDHIALNFLDTDEKTKDIIYQWGLEIWRLRQKKKSQKKV